MAAIMSFIYDKMAYFLGCFSRGIPYEIYVILVLGFMTRPDMLGVTSFIRCFDLDGTGYAALLHFFRASSWKGPSLTEQWCKCVKDNCKLKKIGDKYQQIADGTDSEHEGRQMPAVVKQKDYGTHSQGGYHFTHHWGCVGVVAEAVGKYFCIPIFMGIQGGLKGLASWVTPSEEETPGEETPGEGTPGEETPGEGTSGEETPGEGTPGEGTPGEGTPGEETPKETPEEKKEREALEKRVSPRLASHPVQCLRIAYGIAKEIGPSILTLDRLFLGVPLLKELNALNGEKHLLDILTRAKMNAVAYREPTPNNRGRPRKKGEAVHLAEEFKNLQQFTTVEALIYGKLEEVQVAVLDLLWGKGLYMKLRFVLVLRKNGAKAIFVSSDFTLTAAEIIEGYCARFLIELSFRTFKQQIGGFLSRFWTQSKPALDFFRKSTDPDELELVTNNKDRHSILNTLEAYERFANIGCIAMGLIQMIAANPKFSNLVRQDRWLRTDRGGSVSEATVMWFFSKRFDDFVRRNPNHRISQIISEFRKPRRHRSRQPSCA